MLPNFPTVPTTTPTTPVLAETTAALVTQDPPVAAAATKTFVKHDSGKLLWNLLPWKATEETVEVLTFGAKKYAPNNWRNAEDTQRFLAAAMRHIAAFAMGQKRDPETGIHHLAHAICNMMFIIEWENDHNV